MYCSFLKFFFKHYKQTSTTFTADLSLSTLNLFTKVSFNSALHYYFFFVDARVEGRDDCWDGVRGGWGE